MQMKTPMTLGQKKAKAIEQLLEELSVGALNSGPLHVEATMSAFLSSLRNKTNAD